MDNRLAFVPDPPEQARELEGWSLDAGETAALTYAIGVRSAGEVLVLCDEIAARSVCLSIGLPVAGTIGLILRAAREGRVSAAGARLALVDLPTRGRFHVSPQLLTAAMTALEQPASTQH